MNAGSQNPGRAVDGRASVDHSRGIREWCREAQRIVVHPEDYGMNRQQVRGLERMLARRVRAVRATARSQATLSLFRTALPRGVADLERVPAGRAA